MGTACVEGGADGEACAGGGEAGEVEVLLLLSLFGGGGEAGDLVVR